MMYVTALNPLFEPIIMMRWFFFIQGNTAAVGNGLRNAQIILDGYSWNERPRIAWLVTNRFAEVGLNAEHVATQMKEAGKCYCSRYCHSKKFPPPYVLTLFSHFSVDI